MIKKEKVRILAVALSMALAVGSVAGRDQIRSFAEAVSGGAVSGSATDENASGGS